MKKRLAALLVLALSAASLTACGSKEEASTETASTESTALAEATTTPTLEVVKDEAELGSIATGDYVTLGDYQNLNISVSAIAELSEEELESYVQTFFFNDASVLPAESFLTEGTVAEGDVVLLDYEGKKDGVAFEGGTATDATLGIGSGTFISGFEDGLIGVSVGETVDLNLTFPEYYPNNTELAGQDVVFTVTVKGLVSLTDETIAKLGIYGMETLEAYKEAVKFSIDYTNESAYNEELNDAICQELLNICTVSKLPSKIYEDYKNSVIDSVCQEAAYYGVDGDTYTNMYVGMNLADYAISVAESYIKQALVFQAIANAEDLVPDEEEVNAFVEEYVAAYGESYGIDSVESFYEQNPFEEVKTVMMQDNVVAYLTELANITEAE